MKQLAVSEDIYPIGEFKKHASRLFRRVREEKHPIVVTQNGTPIGVVVPPEEFDAMAERARFFNAVEKGLRDVETGNVLSSEDVDKILDRQFGPLKKAEKR
jgi:prevent-host-death family protein